MAIAPLISVIIPTYNRAGLLVEAIGSVLIQTLADYELIVVDDGSTDETAGAVAGIGDPRIRLVAQAHHGLPARARNEGIERARGRYLAFLDSDNLWDATKLADQMAALGERPGWRWCHTGLRCIDMDGHPHPWQPTPRFAPEGWIAELLLRRREGVNSSSVVVERSFVLEVGGFDETFVWGEDYDLWVRLALRSPVACVREPRVRHRIHPEQFTRVPRRRMWQAPQVAILRTLARTARAAPSWRLRALCVSEALQLSARYAAMRVRGALGRLRRWQPGSPGVTRR
jgi:glycosyltransferase involved in cell wall biosynthesis